MLQIIEHIGPVVSRVAGKTYIDSRDKTTGHIVPARGGDIRASLYLIGALLSNVGAAIVPAPGGCAFPDRDYKLHPESFHHLGYHVTERQGVMAFSRTDCHEQETHIRLPLPSRGLTGNHLLAALGRNERFQINNANTSPEIRFMIETINHIHGHERIILNEATIVILKPHQSRAIITSPFRIPLPGDRIEAGTFASLSMLSGHPIRVRGVPLDHMKDFAQFMDLLGVVYAATDDGFKLKASPRALRSPGLVALGEPPHLDSDYGPVIAPLALRMRHPMILLDRFKTRSIHHTAGQLAPFGLEISEVAPFAYVLNRGDQSKDQRRVILRGADIRSSAGLLIAGLASRRRFGLHGGKHLDRGYDNFLGKLDALYHNVHRKDDFLWN